MSCDRIKMTRWSRFNRPHVYRLSFEPCSQYEVLRKVFGYEEDAARNSCEAIVDDFGELVIIPNYRRIFEHINQDH